jgi:RNA polymerase sigma-70 factor (ECF subfamily)
MLSPEPESTADLAVLTVSDAERATARTAIEDRVLLLFDECGTGLRRYVASFGLSIDESEDVVQEVFLSLFRHLLLGRSERNLRGWLFRVAHNLALKQRHAVQRRNSRQSFELPLDRADPSPNPEEQVAEVERQEQAYAVLRTLPARDRRCVYLRAEGLRYREIARVVGLSLGAVAKSLTRSLTRLTNADLR